MRFTKILSKKSFAIYGLGVTGKSVVKYLKKKKVKNLFIWDDTKKIQKKYKLPPSIKTFSNSLNFVDYIILSPGININKSKIKKKLIKNKQKIITDIDLFYMSNDNIKSIVVTGSNGKSTTCKLIEHILKKSKFKTQIGGNIGKPILSLKKAKKNIFIIEASSFQLAYSKYIKPTYAIMLNISRDHLDWHRTVQNYINAKFKIFSLQDKKDYSFLLDSKLLRLYKKRKFLGKLKTIKLKSFKSIKHKIKNKYLISKINEENMSLGSDRKDVGKEPIDDYSKLDINDYFYEASWKDVIKLSAERLQNVYKNNGPWREKIQQFGSLRFHETIVQRSQIGGF